MDRSLVPLSKLLALLDARGTVCLAATILALPPSPSLSQQTPDYLITSKDCGGSSICKHQRQRRKCKDCGGSSFCKHQRERNTCKDCGGAGICEHRRTRSKCKDCRPERQTDQTNESTSRRRPSSALAIGTSSTS